MTERHHTDVPPARKRTLVVAGLIVDEFGRLLLSRRRSDQPMGGLWELPGGKLEPGEGPQGALARELREELGVEARILTVYDVVHHPYPEFDLLMLVYRAELLGEPRAVEVAELAWVDPSQLASYPVLPADVGLVDRVRSEALAATTGSMLQVDPPRGSGLP